MAVVNPEGFWSDVLSGDPERVRHAVLRLEGAARRSVLDHLRRMSSEPGWQPSQRANARRALSILASDDDPPAQGAT